MCIRDSAGRLGQHLHHDLHRAGGSRSRNRPSRLRFRHEAVPEGVEDVYKRQVRESATGRNRAQKGAEGGLVALQTL